MAQKEGYIKLEDEVGASLSSTVVNSVKSVMGAGILTLSWAFYFSSLWPGIIGTVVMCAFSAYGFYLIGLCSEHTGEKSFGGIWSSLFGTMWAWLPDMVIVLFCGTCIVSYLIVCGDYLPRGLAGFGIPQVHRAYYILGASLSILPLNFLEDLSILAYTSGVGNFSVFYTTVLLFYLCLTTDVDADWEPWALEPGIFLTIPTIAFSTNGHFGVPQMYQQLKGKSPRRWMKVTVLAYSACLPVVLVCGITGYLMFGSALNLPNRSNILLAPSMTGPLVMVAFVAMTLQVLFNIPIHTNAVRSAINGMWVRAMGLDAKADAIIRKQTISVLIITITNITALSVDSLGLTVAINGAVCATLVMYVFPALMYMKIYGPGCMPCFLVILGVVVGVAGVATTVMQASGESDALMPRQ